MKSEIPLHHTYILVAILCLATCLLYSQSLSAPFTFDDFTFFTSKEKLTKYGYAFFNFDTRWLSYSSLGLTVRWFGQDIFWLRIGNILLHAANAIALFYLLRRLFQVTLPDSFSPSLIWFAFLGALIFTLHPVSVYAVAYLIERSILMATMFTLLMLIAYLEGLLRVDWRWMLAAVLFYFAAVYSKEHSITAPGVALVMTFLIRKPSATLFKQIAPYFILASLIAVTVAMSVKGVLGELYEPRAADMLDRIGMSSLPNVHWLSILTQSTLFFKYLALWLIPDPAWMSVDMREPFAISFFSWPFTLGLLTFLTYPCVALWLLLKQGRWGLLGFAMLFPWMLFLTEWSVIRVQEPFVLYRSYLWMPGLFVALPVILNLLSPKKTFILLAIYSVLLLPLTLNRLNTFSSALLLWDDAEKLVRNRPEIYGTERIYNNLGNELMKLKRYDEAMIDFNHAINLYPEYEMAYINRATNYYFLGKFQEAILDYQQAMALNPNNPQIYYRLALTYRSLGNFNSEMEYLKKSCSMGLCPQL